MNKRFVNNVIQAVKSVMELIQITVILVQIHQTLP